VKRSSEENVSPNSTANASSAVICACVIIPVITACHITSPVTKFAPCRPIASWFAPDACTVLPGFTFASRPPTLATN
jgi:hypothetical protein